VPPRIEQVVSGPPKLPARAPLDSYWSDVQREDSDMPSIFSEYGLREAWMVTHFNPDDTALLLRYAPAALTHLGWRNSVIED
jgi:hypothetical protein